MAKDGIVIYVCVCLQGSIESFPQILSFYKLQIKIISTKNIFKQLQRMPYNKELTTIKLLPHFS